jgi:hypothetical protein
VTDIEQVTEWGALGCLSAYEERARLSNLGDGYVYSVDEDHSQLVTRYRIVRRRAQGGAR